MEIKINKKLSDEIQSYCNLNGITDVDGFVQKLIKKGFDTEKWGDLNVIEQEPIIPNTPVITIKTESIPTQTIKEQNTIATEPEKDDIYGDN